MAELQTKPTGIPVADFINTIPDAQTRQDCWTIIDLMQDVVQAPPKMWGPAIVGFGDSRLVYPNGKTIDWMLTAFSHGNRPSLCISCWTIMKNWMNCLPGWENALAAKSASISNASRMSI